MLWELHACTSCFGSVGLQLLMHQQPAMLRQATNIANENNLYPVQLLMQQQLPCFIIATVLANQSILYALQAHVQLADTNNDSRLL